MKVFDSDCGSEFINHEVAGWLQARDIAQTRVLLALRHPAGAGAAQPTVAAGVAAADFFTPTKKPIAYTTTADGRKKRIYDKPKTPRRRLDESGVLTAQQLSTFTARIEGVNPADLTRQINAIQMQLLDLAQAKTEALAAARHIDLEALQPSINRLAKAK